MKILVLNSGSSSLRFEVFSANGREWKSLRSLYKGHFDNRGKAIENFDEAVKNALCLLIDKKIIGNLEEICTTGHRVVHGGEKYTAPVKITPDVINEIRRLFPLAPLHNPPNLACILAAKKLLPDALQVAVFDTAFHQTTPEKAFLYGIPSDWKKKFGIRRFGFHGISHQYVFERARAKLGRAKVQKTVTCHLGNGCSIAAILDGKVIDTSMGFTPLAGVPMGTRSGDIDPSIIFYLLKKGLAAEKIERTLNEESGLSAVFGESADMRDVWAAASKGKKQALFALDWFAYAIAKQIGAYAAALRGLDCIVFTGGIGENAPYLRKRVMRYLKKIRVLVIKTDEARKIAEETEKLV